MDIGTLVEQMIAEGAFRRVLNNPLAQFGPRTAPFLGAQFLPEQQREENYYREEAIQYRTFVANDNSRYSPVQIKGGVMTGWMDVGLADSDTGSHFTGSDYDALLRILKRSGQGPAPMSAVDQIIQWTDRTLLRPLMVKNEVMRWQALINAKVIRSGDNGYYEEVGYSDPTGHRVSAGGDWTDDTYDPFPDIIAIVKKLKDKGFTVNRIVTSTDVLNVLLANAKMKERVGKMIVAAGVAFGIPSRLSQTELNQIFADNRLPAIETYDETYRTQTSTEHFLPRNVMFFACTTGRDQTIDLGDVNPLTIQNTIGYTGVGRPVGQSGPGRVVKVRHIDDSKPPRIEGESWQTSLPVILDPEAIAVIKDIDLPA